MLSVGWKKKAVLHQTSWHTAKPVTGRPTGSDHEPPFSRNRFPYFSKSAITHLSDEPKFHRSSQSSLFLIPVRHQRGGNPRQGMIGQASCLPEIDRQARCLSHQEQGITRLKANGYRSSVPFTSADVSPSQNRGEPYLGRLLLRADLFRLAPRSSGANVQLYVPIAGKRFVTRQPDWQFFRFLRMRRVFHATESSFQGPHSWERKQHQIK
jgi:hypothetical protein